MAESTQLREIISLMQHHDTITGTSPSVTILDYRNMMFTAIKDLSENLAEALKRSDILEGLDGVGDL